MLHVRQLQCLRALAEHRHFGRAADAIGITQSGLTQSIARLEAHYGVRLFDRDRRGVTPTAFGDVLIDGAGDVLERLADVERRIRLMDSLATGELSVGADPMLSSAVLAPAFASLLASHPKLRLQLRTGAWPDLAPALERGELDLYIGFPHPAMGPRVQRQDLEVAAPRVVMAPDHPLLQAPAPSLADYMAYPLVQGPVAQWFLDWADSQLAGTGLVPPSPDTYFLQTDDAGMLVALIRRSQALMAAMWEDVRLPLQAGELAERPPDGWPQRVPATIVTASGRTPLPAVERLAEVIVTAAAHLEEYSA